MRAALRRAALALLIGVSALYCFALAATGWHRYAAYQSTDNAYVKADITAVSARVPGYVVKLYVDDYSVVEPHQTLLSIDPRDYRSAVAEAQATVAKRQAELQRLQSRLDYQQALVEVADGAVESTQAEAARDATTLRRTSRLLTSRTGTQADFDAAQAAALVAEAALVQARAARDAEQRQLAVLGAEQSVLKADVQAARAALTTAQRRLEDVDVWAPLAGTVTNTAVELGEYVTVGMRLMAIVPDDGLWIDANFRETQLERLRRHDPVEIRLDMYPDQVLCGYVEHVGPASGSEFALLPPDNASGNFTKIVRRFPVRIRPLADEPNLDLFKPGMSAVVTVAPKQVPTDGVLLRLSHWLSRPLYTPFRCHVDPTRYRAPPPRRLPDHPGL